MSSSECPIAGPAMDRCVDLEMDNSASSQCSGFSGNGGSDSDLSEWVSISPVPSQTISQESEDNASADDNVSDPVVQSETKPAQDTMTIEQVARRWRSMILDFNVTQYVLPDIRRLFRVEWTTPQERRTLRRDLDRRRRQMDERHMESMFGRGNAEDSTSQTPQNNGQAVQSAAPNAQVPQPATSTSNTLEWWDARHERRVERFKGEAVCRRYTV